MRFAYVINDVSNTIAHLTLLNASDTADQKIATISVGYTRSAPGQPWTFNGILLPDVSIDHSRLVRNIKTSITEATKVSPLKLVMELAQSGARQVIYDDRLKKYRNVTTMKEGEDTYAAVGVKGITVTAENEEAAINRVKKLITNAMMENPKSAGELSGWFTAGCKVSKLASGKLPDVVGREQLAGPGEKELATKSVVVRPKMKKEKKVKG